MTPINDDDLVSLPDFEAIARIGNDVVRFNTLYPLQPQAKDFRDQVIKESRRKYYLPSYEVKKLIRQRQDRWAQQFTPLKNIQTSKNKITPEEFYYDEF